PNCNIIEGEECARVILLIFIHTHEDPPRTVLEFARHRSLISAIWLTWNTIRILYLSEFSKGFNERPNTRGVALILARIGFICCFEVLECFIGSKRAYRA